MGQDIVPKVFVSAASSDLRSARTVVNAALNQIGCMPDEESIFGTEYGEIHAMIEKRLSGCDAVIHLVGRDYGGEPDPTVLPEGRPRRSWSQLEYDYAIERGMKLYVIVCADTYSYDPPKGDGFVEEPEELRALQAAHRQNVLAGKHLWHQVADAGELRQRVVELNEPAEAWRAEIRHERAKRRRLTHAVIVVGVFIAIALAGIVGQNWQEKEVVEGIPQETAARVLEALADPQELSTRLRQEIETRFEADRDAARSRNANWKEIRQLERLRDAALAQVDGLIRTIKNGLAGTPDPIFAEASRILVDEGPEAAIAYLESHRTEILSRVDKLAKQEEAVREEKHKALEPLLLEADLNETNLRWETALELYETVAGKAPQWSRAQYEYGSLLRILAHYPESEVHLLSAFDLANNNVEIMQSVNDLGLLYSDQAKWDQAESYMKRFLKACERSYGRRSVETAVALNNLASLYRDTGRYLEAEKRYRRSLFIDEQFQNPTNLAPALINLAELLRVTARFPESETLLRRAIAISESHQGPAHPVVAGALNNLGLLLQKTNRFSESELLFRRVLAIEESNFGSMHPNIARALNNVALVLSGTNRLSDAESLYCRAFSIYEYSHGSGHPDLAIALNNIGHLLCETSRHSIAEPLYRIALNIDKSSYGPSHPVVAIDLLKIASLLKETNRLSDSEPLIRQALAISESAYGHSHPDVAMGVNDLAELFEAKNRLVEAEPLMRRALSIYESSYGPKHPAVAGSLSNLAMLLRSMNRLSGSEPLMRRALSINTLSRGSDAPAVASDLNNLALIISDTGRHVEAESLMRRALSIREALYGPDDPDVATVLNNLAKFFQSTNRLSDAEPLMRRHVEILARFGQLTGHSHPNMHRAMDNYRGLLVAMALTPDEIENRVRTALESSKSHNPIVPELDRTLGPSQPVEEVLQSLDQDYKAESNNSIWMLPLDTPIASHLDSLISPSETRFGSEEPVTPYLNELLGPAEQVDAVLQRLDAFYRKEGKSDTWFLPLGEPIAPHLDKLLGPAEPVDTVLQRLDVSYREQNKPEIWFIPLDKPISPYLEELLGPMAESSVLESGE